MAKVVINIPVVVDCDIRSIAEADEISFNVEKTDFVELTNIVAPTSLRCAVSSISIFE